MAQGTSLTSHMCSDRCRRSVAERCEECGHVFHQPACDVHEVAAVKLQLEMALVDRLGHLLRRFQVIWTGSFVNFDAVLIASWRRSLRNAT